LGTGVGRILIAIVAAFTRADDTIAAAGLNAVDQAGVRIDIITIIAGFKVRIIGFEIKAKHTITAAS
jgi:hypothetical protein